MPLNKDVPFAFYKRLVNVLVQMDSNFPISAWFTYTSVGFHSPQGNDICSSFLRVFHPVDPIGLLSNPSPLKGSQNIVYTSGFIL